MKKRRTPAEVLFGLLAAFAARRFDGQAAPVTAVTAGSYPAVPGYQGGPAPHWYWSTCGQCGGQTRAGLPCGTCGWEYGAVDPADMGLRAAVRTGTAGGLAGRPAGAVTRLNGRFPGDLDEYSVAVTAALEAGLLTAGAGGIWVTEAGVARLEQGERKARP